MPFSCTDGTCRTSRWMRFVLVLVGLSYLGCGLLVFLQPREAFSALGVESLGEPILVRAFAMSGAAIGIGLLFAARNPLKHWVLVLLGWFKALVVLGCGMVSLAEGSLNVPAFLVVSIDDLFAAVPLAIILWVAVRAHIGRAYGGPRMEVGEAAARYRLSSGETLAEASEDRLVVLVFLRHFGCTFTRKLLRELETLKASASDHHARLVLVHMLRSGAESTYLSDKQGVARIADPMCDLYRAFGLGKGTFLELFGPRVWLPILSALIRGCGVGPVAGDGLQLPGVFLFRHNRIVAAQRARSQADLPDLPRLFDELPERADAERVPA